MVQRRSGLGLGLEPPEEHGIVGERRVQHLDRHPPTQVDVVRQVYLRRRSGPHRSEETVPAGQHQAHEISQVRQGHVPPP